MKLPSSEREPLSYLGKRRGLVTFRTVLTMRTAQAQTLGTQMQRQGWFQLRLKGVYEWSMPIISRVSISKQIILTITTI